MMYHKRGGSFFYLLFFKIPSHLVNTKLKIITGKIMATKVGLEVLMDKPELANNWGKCCLLSNQASLARNWDSSVDSVKKVLGKRLVSLMAPQHGFWCTEQDNMIETEDMYHSSGLKIYSLYSHTREPTREMLESIDTLIVDLQITGCRIYTFKSSIAACLRAALNHGKRVVVLDRANPVGGQIIEGPCLEPPARSFVGEYPIPMRHGLSAGEAAMFFNLEIGAELCVVPMECWDPTQVWAATGRKWVPTSPNLPSEDSVYVYPGMVLFEGTNISEGRGTCQPFQLIGAPYCDDENKLQERVRHYVPDSKGLIYRGYSFQPTFGKWQGEVCRGLQLIVTEPNLVCSFTLAIGIIKSFIDLYPNQFQYKEPPYEYEYAKNPMNIILGSLEGVEYLHKSKIVDPFWKKGHEDFLNKSQDILVYKRERFSSLY